MWEISFVPLEWCSENKMNTSNRLRYSCFLLYHFWPYFKYGNSLNVICACKWNVWKKKKRGVFYILLYVFLHFRTKFGEPFSVLVARIGNLVCLVVCSHYCSNVNDSVASASFSEAENWNQTKCPAWAGDALLCRSVVQGEACGLPLSFPAELYSSHLERRELG